MGIILSCENAHFTYKILQYIYFNCTYYTCSYDKCVWYMSQYNKLSDIQYSRFQMLPGDLHFGLFWSAGIPTMCVWCYTCAFIHIATKTWLSVWRAPFRENTSWIINCDQNCPLASTFTSYRSDLSELSLK